MNFVTSSDISAAIAGSGFSEVYGGPGSPGMLAARSFIISVVARMVSSSTTMSSVVTSLDTNQKDQLIVGLLNGIASYYKKERVLKGIMGGISIDLIAMELLKLTNMEDKVLIGGPAV